MCAFGCVTICGCKDIVCRRLVFFPPRPMYELEDRLGEDGSSRQIMWILDDESRRVENSAFSNKNFRVTFVPAGKNTQLAVMVIRHPRAKYSILFSHGNATDIGCMRDHLIDTAIQLEVNIYCYDYVGYGLSTGGKAQLRTTLSNIEAVFSFMTTTERIPENTIVLYGQSLGSAPTLHLACKRENILGVVVHSGMMSGLRVIREVTATRWFDILPNIDNIRHVAAPVFVIHGQQDEEIPCHHGASLADAAPVKYDPWFVPSAGHNDIEVLYRPQFFDKLRDFVTFLDKKNTPAPEDDSASALVLVASQSTELDRR